MSLDIGDALGRGYRRTVARNGLLLVAITYVLNLVNGVFGTSTSSLPTGSFPMENAPAVTQPLIPVPLLVDSLLSLVFGILSVLVTAAALRTFVGDDTEGLPTERFTRNGLLTFLNLFVGFIVFSILVGIGFVLLIVPGIFLFVSLVFWPVFVAVEDENFVTAFERSWNLATGNRLVLFGLGVIVFVIGIIVSLIFGLPSALLGPAAVIVAGIGSAFVTVYGYAVLSSAYLQLQAEEPAAAEDPQVAETTEE